MINNIHWRSIQMKGPYTQLHAVINEQVVAVLQYKAFPGPYHGIHGQAILLAPDDLTLAKLDARFTYPLHAQNAVEHSLRRLGWSK